MAKMKTIGTEAMNKAKEYFELYKQFKADPKLADRAENLAKVDILSEQLVCEYALQYLDQMIKESESQ